MNRPTASILSGALLALLLAGCSIDEVTEETRVGTLYFRAVNAELPSQSVPGQLRSSNQFLMSYSEDNGGWARVDGVVADSIYRFRFLPEQAENWVEVLGDRAWMLPQDRDTDSLSWNLTPIEAGLLSLTVRTALPGGAELAGLPLELDGQPWPEPSPAVIQFTPNDSHLIEVVDERCSRGSAGFSYAVAPTEDLVVDLSSVTLRAEAPGGLVYFDGLDTGSSVFEATNPSLGLHFVSAYRGGQMASPSGVWVDAFCDSETLFEFTPVPAGYTADQQVPDFALPAFDPVDGSALGEIALRDFRGRLTLLTFWFIDCAACQAEMPHFQELLEAYGDRGFSILALNPLANDAAAEYPDYDFHFLKDLGSPPVTQSAQVTAFPTNIVVRPDGTVRSRHGSLTREALQAILDEYCPAP